MLKTGRAQMDKGLSTCCCLFQFHSNIRKDNFDLHQNLSLLRNEKETLKRSTLWFQLEDMFQLIVTPQGIEKVTIQLKDTPTKVYAIGA